MESNQKGRQNTECLLSIVIPIYQEITFLAESIKKVEENLISQYPAELIIVNDGIEIQKWSMYNRLWEDKQYLRIIHNERNRGKGFSVKQGVLASNGKYVFYTDVDLPYDLSLIPLYLQVLEKDAELTIGSRVHPDSFISIHPDSFHYMFLRHLMGKAYNVLANKVLKIHITDTQCAFKCFRREVAQKLFSMITLDGFAFDVEMLFLARKLGFKIHEMPVKHIHEKHSSSVHLTKDPLRMIWAFFKILRREREDSYTCPTSQISQKGD